MSEENTNEISSSELGSKILVALAAQEEVKVVIGRKMLKIVGIYTHEESFVGGAPDKWQIQVEEFDKLSLSQE